MRLMKAFVFLLPALAGAAEFPSWMAGSWHGTAAGVKMEEHWTSADGSLMLGMHRDVQADGRASFEFSRIEVKDGKLVYQAMPSGRPPTPFTMIESSERRVVFANPQHDFPQQIIYFRDGERLCARVEGTISGRTEAEQWCWTRTDAPR